MATQPNAHLQHGIILRLARSEPFASVADLARELDASRPSASRALHVLAERGLVVKRRGRWKLTMEGRRHAEALRTDIGERVDKLAGETARRIRQQVQVMKITDLEGMVGPSVARSLAEAIKLASSPPVRDVMKSANFTAAAQAMTSLNEVFATQTKDAAAQAAGMFSSDAAAFDRVVSSVTEQMRVAAPIEKMAAALVPQMPSPAAPFAADAVVWRDALSAFEANHQAMIDDMVETINSPTREAVAVMSGMFNTLAEATRLNTAFDAVVGVQVQAFQEQLNAKLWAMPQLDLLHQLPGLNWPWLEELAEERRVADAFAYADLVPSPSMDPALIDRVVMAHEAGASPDDLVNLVMQVYDADDCARIQAIVTRLSASPDFSERRLVLEQALMVHRQGLNAVTAYILVPIIEGVMTTFIFDHSDGTKWPKHNEIATVLGELPVSFSSSVGWQTYWSLIELLEHRLYQGSDWKSEDAETRKQYLQLNRHRLLHGLAIQGTRDHALRCFLILDTIDVLLPAICLLLKDEDGARAHGTETSGGSTAPTET